MVHGELPLIHTVDPYLMGFEFAWEDWLEIPDRPAKWQLCGGELDPIDGVIAVLDEGSGDLVPVVTAIISRVVCQRPGSSQQSQP